MSWFHKAEKAGLRSVGAKRRARRKPFADGTTRGGRPVEVKAARSAGRFRVGQKAHARMVATGGLYVFKRGNRTKRLTARRVSRALPRGAWFKDRTYPHKIISARRVGL